ncbi:MAG: DedA family protein [Candidatus Marsarchaeota archaeon]|nr:DedA family protein [Candidatus Marsarchaeota archaeon]
MVLPVISSAVGSSFSIIEGIISSHGYAAIFILMVLESSSIPVPSEIVLPLAGVMAAEGILGFYPALLVATVGSLIGMGIDYYIGYFVGKDIVYRHLELFHVTKTSLRKFDRWFDQNGEAVVFISRMVPVIRTVASLPAGFARMAKRKFFTYSAAGALVWDAVLMGFGFVTFNSYNGSAASATIILIVLALFGTVLYFIYHTMKKHLR